MHTICQGTSCGIWDGKYSTGICSSPMIVPAFLGDSFGLYWNIPVFGSESLRICIGNASRIAKRCQVLFLIIR